VGLWFTTFLVAAAAASTYGVQSAVFWMALCLLGGAGAPSLGPAMRAQWREATPDARRQSAYALDAIAEEVLFLVGPLAASAVLYVGEAWWGIVLTALVAPVGIAALVLSPHAPHPRSGGVGRREWWGPLRRAGFRRLLLVMSLAGASASSWATVLAGLADRQGRPSLVGIVEAVVGVASVLGALWWGRLRVHQPWPRVLAIMLGLHVPLALVCLVHPSLAMVALTLAVTGFTMAPLYVVAYAASDAETDPRHHTEAGTWVNSVTNVGTSVGAAGAAWIFARADAGTAFVLVLALLLVAILTVAWRSPPQRQARG
jgi:predicted MFS family arabinose efflux permease